MSPPTTYATVAVSDLSGLWQGLKGLAACREYRDVCLFAGTRLISSLAPKSEEVRITQLAVAKALPMFEPSPVSPLPQFTFQALRRVEVSLGPRSRWSMLQQRLEKTAPVVSEASETMRQHILPHLRSSITDRVAKKSRVYY